VRQAVCHRFTLGVLLLAAIVQLAGCVGDSHELRILPVGYQRVDTDALQAIFEQQSSVRLKRAALGDSNRPSLERLASAEVDLAFVQNSNVFVPGVRVVLPAYRSLLHMLAREELPGADTGLSLRGKTVYIANNSSSARMLLRVAARRQHVGEDEYRVVSTLEPGQTDVIVYFGPVVANDPPWYRPGYRFVSFERRPGQTGGGNPDVVRYLVPNMYAATIPAGTYDIPGNEDDRPTIATDTLLVTHKDVPEDVIYELTRTLLEQKPRFTAVAPQLFQGVNESFDPLELSFPLHSGARRYLARDEPGFLERYAEMINMLVYVAFLLLTGLLGLARWRYRLKKDRIDGFYLRVLAVRARASSEEADSLRNELMEIEHDAFRSLIAERLAADESFRIFTDLLERVRKELD
jgi:TRAP-type uncharacterized transport system substrate-binding protein